MMAVKRVTAKGPIKSNDPVVDEDGREWRNCENYVKNSHVWKRKRKEKLKLVPTCERCGKGKPLECHHNNYDRAGSELMDDLVIYCKACHAKFHRVKYNRLGGQGIKRKKRVRGLKAKENGAAQNTATEPFSTLVVDHVEMIDPATLNEAEYNPREITAEALKRLQTIIEHHGFVNPIIVNKINNTVIGGNQRLKAAIAIGMDKVPVVFVSKGVEDEKALNVALNAEYGVFEKTRMMDVLASLTPAGYDLNMSGFNPAQFKKMLGANWEKELMAQVNGSGVAKEEEIPEVPKKPKSKLGDLYELGDHRLLCGDATKADDYMKLLGKEKAAMMFTDPPYGVDYGSKNEFLNSMDGGNRIEKKIKQDNLSPQQMKKFWIDSLSKVPTVLNKGACYYVMGPSGSDLLLLLLLALEESGMPSRHMIIWAKNNHVFGRSDYHYKHEPLMYGWVGGAHKFYGGGGEVSVWEIDKPHKSDLHPTMKPIELCERGIRNSSKLQDIVLDPFGGSGSTLIACENLGRRCRMMEIDPGYVDVICMRYENATGKKAKKIKNA